ncbi:Ccc1 family [Talaromyces proteolyticus]|uniref:Ccc1 family n=1 Tax=Talaromyces proteolyticus TaxID=1131652 RepID=A0AAD4KFM1_9EURO|nr:Ccc1 family [Talaromyces proteolyticus]KAH8690840.1 Ccc1 family [Talaromyces proteolyticus]
MTDHSLEPPMEVISPQDAHIASERHSDAGDVVRDVIIGFADGLTVPFALTAGLSSLGSSKLVIVGGLAELFSGAISMGLGAYLACVTDRDHYNNEIKRERGEVSEKPEEEKEEIFDIFASYGISRAASQGVVDCLVLNEDNWIRFMMDFELRLEKPNVSRAWISAATMGFSYFMGGLLPMIPYFAMHNVTHALFVSIGVTFVILIAFGFIKNYIIIKTKRSGFYGAMQTLFVGTLAAATSYGIVYGIDHSNIG